MNKKSKWTIAVALSAVAILALGTYVKRSLKPVARLAAVPEDQLLAAQIPGIPNARYYVASDLEPLVREVVAARGRERVWLAGAGHEGELPPAALLAISGGGDNGAFGAGLLNGWTAAGTRPVFKAVTGVSTGALIAPFAFLGKEYDPVLQEVYTRISPEDVARSPGIGVSDYDRSALVHLRSNLGAPGGERLGQDLYRGRPNAPRSARDRARRWADALD